MVTSGETELPTPLSVICRFSTCVAVFSSVGNKKGKTIREMEFKSTMWGKTEDGKH